MAKQRERILQQSCVTWFRLQYPTLARLLIGIPNGTKFGGSQQQRAIMGKRLKDEGMMPGAPDLFLFVASGELHGLGIEMKVERGQQSDNQLLFETALIEQGYGYVIPRTLDEFQQAIRRYLETGEY